MARQFKWSVFTDEAFAPTSAYVVFRLLLQRALEVPSFVMYTLDVKDAFLLVDQPPEENAFVVHASKTYKL